MIHLTAEVNSPIQVTLQSLTQDQGQQIPADLLFLKDGVVMTAPTVAYSEVGIHGLYNFGFSFNQTGIYTMYAYGALQARLDVVSRSVYSYLQNIEDEALGSWQWDKVAGTLVMVRQDGTTFASFTVIDNLTESNRERTT